MSRKNLARTVIEGGRYFRNHYQRDQSHRIERASTRVWIDRVTIDSDEADHTAPPRRPPVRKSFRDKLGPAMRWLDSQTGRPWNKVYSELCTKFDRRSLAGMHVVDAHLVGEVWRGDLSAHRRRDFFVDAHGILRRDPLSKLNWKKLRAHVRTWTLGRHAAMTYMGWWWFRAVGVDQCAGLCGARHARVDGLYYHRTRHVADAAVTKGELRRIDRLPSLLRDEVIIRWP